MGEEREPSWYDHAYGTRPVSYYESPETYWYAPLWKAIIEEIRTDQRIADFGCGVGQFAKICTQMHRKYVKGIDFSKVAIEIAKQLNPELTFVVGSLMEPNTYDFEFDVAVFCETMEHIKDDIKVLSMIPVGTKIIITLPTYDYKSHVRYIKTEKDLERYNKLMETIKIKKIYLNNGEEKNGERIVYMIVGVRR